VKTKTTLDIQLRGFFLLGHARLDSMFLKENLKKDSSYLPCPEVS